MADTTNRSVDNKQSFSIGKLLFLRINGTVGEYLREARRLDDAVNWIEQKMEEERTQKTEAKQIADIMMRHYLYKCQYLPPNCDGNNK